MTERDKAILLAPFVFLAAAAWLGWMQFRDMPDLADPQVWTRAEATVRLARRDCDRTQRLGGDCAVKIWFDDLKGPVRCPATFAPCDALNDRLPRGTRVSLSYRCAPEALDFGRGCSLGALSLVSGGELLNLEQTVRNRTAGAAWQLPAAIVCLVIGIGAAGYLYRRT